jgi:hypothetical protein
MTGASQAGPDWGRLFARCERELKMRKWEIARYTLSQLANALDRSDPDDPHAGQMSLNSLDQLHDLFEID